MKKRNLWHKFIECDCGAEGIMLSTEDCLTDSPRENGQRQIYLAFFQNGWNGKQLSFSQKLRWIWQILTKGIPFGDTVILNIGNALLLKHYLGRFIDGKWPHAYKEVKKDKKKKLSVAQGCDYITLGYSEKEIENLYHPEKVL